MSGSKSLGMEMWKHDKQRQEAQEATVQHSGGGMKNSFAIV